MTAKYKITQIETVCVRNDQYIIIDGNPCKVTRCSKTAIGKFGYKKVIITAKNMITNKMVEWMGNGEILIYTFIPIRMKYVVVNVDNDTVEYADINGDTLSLKIPSEELLNEISKKFDTFVDVEIEIMYLPIMKSVDEIEDYQLVYSIKEMFPEKQYY